MAHLGASCAAFVDGQLSDAAMRDADRHLESCDECEKAVRQQRLLKSRMSTVASPEPPAALLASLAGLAAEPPARIPWWSRLGRSVPFRAGVALATASLVVVATAYVAGGPMPRGGDEVAPPYDRYASEFAQPESMGAGTVITAAAMDDLAEYGWACHDTLAGDLQRVSGSYTDDGEVISLAYTDGTSRLNLFERAGVLDTSTLDDFGAEEMAGSRVWVRWGVPTIVTWDDDGTVFTMATDLDRQRIEQAVAQLPVASTDRSPGERVGDGLDRMSGWIGAT